MLDPSEKNGDGGDSCGDGVKSRANESGVQVFVRVRPQGAREAAVAGEKGETVTNCVSVPSARHITLQSSTSAKHFEFDKVFQDSASQADVFEAVGAPMVEHCLGGFNASIFAYGQTGAGKTFTMLGNISASAKTDDKRGLTPRVFERMFERIQAQEGDTRGDVVRFSCRISFLEIYNETITDLLEPSKAASDLQLRDTRTGVFVEGLSEHGALNADDVLKLMMRGLGNRRVRETRLNSSSSRSHSVFMCTVERSTERGDGGVTEVIRSRMNLIDLAGSERVKGGAVGGAQAQGEQFKEAVSINKSLTTLGRVITVLSDAAKKGPTAGAAQSQHIPYRDSKLTFLLQDSLGGNAKTAIIANVSPVSVCVDETGSTLNFAQRAKSICNRATVNLDYRGDVSNLQKELRRLTAEVQSLKSDVNAVKAESITTQAMLQSDGLAEAAAAATSAAGLMELRKVLEEEQTSAAAAAAEMAALRKVLEAEQAAHAAAIDAGADELAELRKMLEAEQVSSHLVITELAGLRKVLEDEQATSRHKLSELDVLRTEMVSEKATSAGDLARFNADLAKVDAELADALDELGSERCGHALAKSSAAAKLAAMRDELEAEQSSLDELQKDLDTERAQAATLAAQMQQELDVVRCASAEAVAERSQVAALAAQLQQELDAERGAAAKAVVFVGLASQLQAEVAELQKVVAAEGCAGAKAVAECIQAATLAAQLQKDLDTERSAAAEAVSQLQKALEAERDAGAKTVGLASQLQEEVAQLQKELDAGKTDRSAASAAAKAILAGALAASEAARTALAAERGASEAARTALAAEKAASEAICTALADERGASEAARTALEAELAAHSSTSTSAIDSAASLAAALRALEAERRAHQLTQGQAHALVKANVGLESRLADDESEASALLTLKSGPPSGARTPATAAAPTTRRSSHNALTSDTKSTAGGLALQESVFLDIERWLEGRDTEPVTKGAGMGAMERQLEQLGDDSAAIKGLLLQLLSSVSVWPLSGSLPSGLSLDSATTASSSPPLTRRPSSDDRVKRGAIASQFAGQPDEVALVSAEQCGPPTRKSLLQPTESLRLPEHSAPTQIPPVRQTPLRMMPHRGVIGELRAPSKSDGNPLAALKSMVSPPFAATGPSVSRSDSCILRTSYHGPELAMASNTSGLASPMATAQVSDASLVRSSSALSRVSSKLPFSLTSDWLKAPPMSVTQPLSTYSKPRVVG